MEIWRIIDGTNGRYSVSSFGNVRANWSDVPQRNKDVRVRIEKTVILRPYLHTTGYWRINLGRKNRHYVHRLIAKAFIENLSDKPQVDHIDGDRKNNQITNLRWVSAKENTDYGGTRHGFEPQKNAARAAAFHPQRVEAYRALYAEGLSMREIARRYNTCHTSISRVLRMPS